VSFDPLPREFRESHNLDILGRDPVHSVYFGLPARTAQVTENNLGGTAVSAVRSVRPDGNGEAVTRPKLFCGLHPNGPARSDEGKIYAKPESRENANDDQMPFRGGKTTYSATCTHTSWAEDRRTLRHLSQD
jgi:hypothetical protein